MLHQSKVSFPGPGSCQAAGISNPSFSRQIGMPCKLCMAGTAANLLKLPRNHKHQTFQACSLQWPLHRSPASQRQCAPATTMEVFGSVVLKLKAAGMAVEKCWVKVARSKRWGSRKVGAGLVHTVADFPQQAGRGTASGLLEHHTTSKVY